jgi:aliphatic nitrilase
VFFKGAHVMQQVFIELYNYRPAWAKCAAWPSYSLYAKLSKAFSPEVSINVNQVYAVEGQCFVLSSCSVVDQAISDMLVQNELHEKFLEVGAGYSRIFGPNGAEFGENLPHDKEGPIVADIDLGLISHSKSAADPAGHYVRPDALALMHNRNPRRPVIGFGEATRGSRHIVERRGIRGSA